MKPKYFVPLVLFSALSGTVFICGCMQSAPSEEFVNAFLDTEFRLKLNQTALIENEEIKIKFLGVSEDSRCPSDVVCVWVGRAAITVNIIKNSKNLGNFNLTTEIWDEKSATKNFDGYKIKLLSLEPYPKTAQNKDILNYTATLIVSRRTT